VFCVAEKSAKGKNKMPDELDELLKELDIFVARIVFGISDGEFPTKQQLSIARKLINASYFSKCLVGFRKP
jgi:hypothetical protein